MPLRQRLDLRQRQTLALTPAMRASLGLLRLPADLLIEELAREAAENPYLDLRLPTAGNAFEFAAETVAGKDSLPVALARQIDLQKLPADVRQAALLLITELRGDGYLDASLEELAAEYD
ncbi:MAG: hypothetical protein ORN49_06515, partial [Rhodobacteraceae bacterium]|nr:hypothetical protein [Paracoccaceae bacterium]